MQGGPHVQPVCQRPCGQRATEGGYLRSSDLSMQAGDRIAVKCCVVVAPKSKAVRSPDDVQACLHRTHPTGVKLMAICEGLAVVVVFLLAEAE